MSDAAVLMGQLALFRAILGVAGFVLEGPTQSAPKPGELVSWWAVEGVPLTFEITQTTPTIDGWKGYSPRLVVRLGCKSDSKQAIGELEYSLDKENYVGTMSPEALAYHHGFRVYSKDWNALIEFLREGHLGAKRSVNPLFLAQVLVGFARHHKPDNCTPLALRGIAELIVAQLEQAGFTLKGGGPTITNSDSMVHTAYAVYGGSVLIIHHAPNNPLEAKNGYLSLQFKAGSTWQDFQPELRLNSNGDPLCFIAREWKDPPSGSLLKSFLKSPIWERLLQHRRPSNGQYALPLLETAQALIDFILVYSPQAKKRRKKQTTPRTKTSRASA